MSDFSSLCPLFSTGVYGEMTFPTIIVKAISTTTTIGPATPFSRSVIVTHAYAKRSADLTAAVTYTVLLRKMAAWNVAIATAETAFASCLMSTTATAYPISRYKAFTVTATTFGASDLLVVNNSKNEAAMPNIDLIVRYKEK